MQHPLTVGNPADVAIQSCITKALEQRSLMALGYFSIIVSNRHFGAIDPEATFLACSFDAVSERIENRGTHISEEFQQYSAKEIAFKYVEVVNASYRSNVRITKERFTQILHLNKVSWAPDGDQAFDDGSRVLQLDMGTAVRVIAFKVGDDCLPVLKTVAESYLNEELFYQTLASWKKQFLDERESLLSNKPHS